MRLIRLLKNDLAKETADWVDEEIITLSQAESICRRYGVEYGGAGSQTLGYRLLVGLGYFFAGLALITLLGANWDDIPRAVRLLGLVAVTAGVQLVGLQRYLKGQLSAAKALFLFGNMMYGAAIILIAQIYHLGEHMPDGIFWWALGSLPAAVLLQSRLLMLFSLSLAGIWFFTEVQLGFYPALFPVFLISALWLLVRARQSFLLFLLVVAGIGFWAEYTLAYFWRGGRHFDFYVEHVVVGVMLFILAYAVSQWLIVRDDVKAKDYGALLKVWCLRFGLVFLLVMSFEEPWDNLLKATWHHCRSAALLVGLLATAALLIAARSGRWYTTAAAVAVNVVVFLWVGFAPDNSDAVTLQVIDNMLLVGVAAGLIVRGVHSGISHYYYLGILAVFATAVLRYIDLIGDYIGGALLFLAFAALLLGAAKYWKYHQLKQVSR